MGRLERGERVPGATTQKEIGKQSKLSGPIRGEILMDYSLQASSQQRKVRVRPNTAVLPDDDTPILTELLQRPKKQKVLSKNVMTNAPSKDTSPEGNNDGYPFRLRPKEEPEDLSEFERLYGERAIIGKFVATKVGSKDKERIEIAVTNAFEIAFTKWHNFDPHGSGTRLSWITGIAKREFLSGRGELWRHPRIIADPEVTQLALEQVSDKGPATDNSAIQRALPLEKMLGDTPYKGILLAYANGMTPKEIGEVYGISRLTVVDYIAKGKKHLLQIAKIPKDESPANKRQLLSDFFSNKSGDSTQEDHRETDLLPNDTITWKPHVSAEVQRAGMLLRQAREAYGITGTQITERAGLKYVAFAQFEKGEAYQDLNRMYEAAIAEGIDAKYPSMVEMDRLRRGQNWLRTFSSPQIEIDQVVWLLRLSARQSVNEFAKSANLNKRTILDIEAKNELPTTKTLNQIFAVVGIDAMSKEAQRIRLKNKGIEPATIDMFIELPWNQQVRYIRSLLGLTQRNLGKEIYYSDEAVTYFESSSGKMIMSEKTLAQLVGLFDLSTKSTLYGVMLQRIRGEQVVLSDEDRRELLTGPCFFEDYVQQIGKYWLSPEEIQHLNQIKNMEQSSQMLSFLRTDVKHMTMRQVVQKGKISFGTIINAERGTNIANDYIISRLLTKLGYDIHHPITQYVLKLAREEKKRGKKTFREGRVN